MSQEQTEQSGSSAAQWLRGHPAVSAAALLSLGIEPADMPTRVAEEPEILMDLTEAVISESEKQHAPDWGDENRSKCPVEIDPVFVPALYLIDLLRVLETE